MQKNKLLILRERFTTGASVVVLSRLAVMASGLGIVTIAPAMLTSTEQGYFFTFLSLAALQGLFELGISALIIQHFAHINGQLNVAPVGERAAYFRQAGEIKRYSEGYFRRSAIFFAVLVGGGGALFFKLSHGSGDVGIWIAPWGLLVAATTAALLNITGFSTLEGFGLVKEAYAIRSKAVGVLFAVFVAGITASGGLYAYPVALLVSQLYARRAIGVQLTALPLGEVAGTPGAAPEFNDMRHTQRRIAVSAIAGYFTANSITPYAFFFFGPVVAGQVGMTTSMFFAAASLAMALSTASAPMYGQWVAQRKLGAVHDAWKSNVKYSAMCAVAMAAALIIAACLLQRFMPQYAHRFLDIQSFFILSALVLVNTTLTTVSTVLRAFKVEDLMWPSLIAALVSTLLQFVVRVSPSQYFLGMVVYNGFIFLPLAFVLMRRRLGVSAATVNVRM